MSLNDCIVFCESNVQGWYPWDKLLLLVGGVGSEKSGSNIPKRVNSDMLLVQYRDFRKDAPCFACKA